MDKIDFVIPLRKKNMIIRTTIECIIDNYHPRNIYVITNPSDIKYLETIKPMEPLKIMESLCDESRTPL
jgi:hypothetical protein